MIEDINPDIERLRDFCRPGMLDCAWRTAYHRVVVRGLALAAGAHFEYSDDAMRDMIRAEFRALLADHPDLLVCSCHEKERAAALSVPAATP
jgi:hypothetical protein